MCGGTCVCVCCWPGSWWSCLWVEASSLPERYKQTLNVAVTLRQLPPCKKSDSFITSFCYNIETGWCHMAWNLFAVNIDTGWCHEACLVCFKGFLTADLNQYWNKARISLDQYLQRSDPRMRRTQHFWYARADHPALYHSFFHAILRQWNRLPTTLSSTTYMPRGFQNWPSGLNIRFNFFIRLCTS